MSGKGNVKKNRLSINLSLFPFSENPSKYSQSSIKSPKNFEEPNGVVGLGILAAMNNCDRYNCHDPSLKRAAILAVSPRSLSNPIPSFCNKNCSILPANSGRITTGSTVSNIEKRSSVENMELCEEYTCVISHVGDNQIKKREYFDDGCLSGSTNIVVKGSAEVTANLNSGYRDTAVAVVSAPSAVSQGGGFSAFQIAEFLNSCFLCKKQLHGLDIFMYRGEKAFCSADCRHKQILSDECREKCVSGSMKPTEYSASPCSDKIRFLAGFAAA